MTLIFVTPETAQILTRANCCPPSSEDGVLKINAHWTKVGGAGELVIRHTQEGRTQPETLHLAPGQWLAVVKDCVSEGTRGPMPTPLTLLERLNRLLPVQFEALLLQLPIPREEMDLGAPQIQRAEQVLDWADKGRGRMAQVRQVLDSFSGPPQKNEPR